jgi:hypothetical protein
MMQSFTPREPPKFLPGSATWTRETDTLPADAPVLFAGIATTAVRFLAHHVIKSDGDGDDEDDDDLTRISTSR